MPRTYGERASGPFILAEHALRAAEEVRVVGNDAFFAGDFEKAQELYKVAGRHLEAAADIETPDDLGVPGYAAARREAFTAAVDLAVRAAPNPNPNPSTSPEPKP